MYVLAQLLKHEVSQKETSLSNVQSHNNDTSIVFRKHTCLYCTPLTKVLVGHKEQEVDIYCPKHSWSFAV